MRHGSGAWVVVFLCSIAAAGCGDDDEEERGETADAAPALPDAGAPLLARGQYLVDHVSACIDCHTPHNPDGSLALDRYLSGDECLVDTDPEMEAVGCLRTANLTSDPTGLADFTDEEIRAMFQGGVRPDGRVLNPFMPYWVFHNMSDEDAEAVVAYLRTVPPVAHEVPAQQPPWDVVLAEPAAPIDLDEVPEPAEDFPHHDRAVRGRYLAAQAGLCIECHTPELEQPAIRPIDMSKPFWGGRFFPLPDPPFPSGGVFSANLTPDETGLAGWTADDIVRVLHEGIDKQGGHVCPPMPVGPMGAYGGLTDEDAFDIASYIRSLPPADNEVEDICELPAARGRAPGLIPWL
jgi:mono/diheme cytochrome c family protein